MRRLRQLSIWHAALLLPWGVASVSLRRTFNDNSYLWHIRAGDAQIQAGSVLTSDPFSFTMLSSPWRTQSWLADLMYSRIDHLGGLDGSRVLVTGASALLFLLLGLIAYQNSRSLPSTVVFLVGSAITIAGFLVPRPVVISFVLMAAVVIADQDRRLKWLLPGLMWVWASVHGSFIIGLGYLFLSVLRQGITSRRIAEIVVAGIPTLLTAHGLGILAMLTDFVGNRDALDYMREWATPDLLSFPMIPVFLGILGVIWLAGTGRLHSGDWWLMVPFLALIVSANRAVPPAWIALSPLLSRLQVPFESQSKVHWSIIAGVGSLLAAGPFLLPFEGGLDEERFPVQAARHLETGRVFHDDATGGWLIYTQWPDRHVYIDDRAELFGKRIELFADIRAARTDWRTEFEEFGIEEALLPAHAPLTRLLAAEGWRAAYEDPHFVILRPLYTDD